MVRRARKILPYTDQCVIGGAREIALLMRTEGATHRTVPGSDRSKPRTCHLYYRPSTRIPGAFATCAVYQRGEGVWVSDGWIAPGPHDVRVPDGAIPLGRRA